MSSQKSSNFEGQNLGLFIFECFMSVLYLAFGYILLFTLFFNNVVSGGIRIALGVLLGLYGLYRIFRAIRKVIRRNE